MKKLLVVPMLALLFVAAGPASKPATQPVVDITPIAWGSDTGPGVPQKGLATTPVSGKVKEHDVKWWFQTTFAGKVPEKPIQVVEFILVIQNTTYESYPTSPPILAITADGVGATGAGHYVRDAARWTKAEYMRDKFGKPDPNRPYKKVLLFPASCEAQYESLDFAPSQMRKLAEAKHITISFDGVQLEVPDSLPAALTKFNNTIRISEAPAH